MVQLQLFALQCLMLPLPTTSSSGSGRADDSTKSKCIGISTHRPHLDGISQGVSDLVPCHLVVHMVPTFRLGTLFLEEIEK